MPKIDFGIGTFTDSEDPANGQQLVNCFIQSRPGEGEEAVTQVKGCAGSDLVSQDAGNAPVRALISYNGELWGVVGTNLMRALETTTPVVHAALPGVDTDRAELSATRVGLSVVVAGVLFDVVGTGAAVQNTFTTEILTSTDALNGAKLFAVENVNGDKFYASDRLSTVVQGLSFAVAEARRDPIQRVIVSKLNTWLFGTTTTELWYDAGNNPFPLERYQNAMIEIGLLAPGAVTKFQNMICWLGSDKRVYLGQDLQSQPVSVRGMDDIISAASASDLKNAYMFNYVAFSRVFYCLTIPNVGSFEFDDTEKIWHTRKDTDGSVWSVQSSAYHDEDLAHYLGTSDGRILRVNSAVGTEGGNQITHELVAPLSGSQEVRTTYHYAQLDFGVGKSATPGDFTLDYSKDGGNTFVNPRTRPLPPIGRNRVVLRGLGQDRQRRWRLKTNTTEKFDLHNAYVGGRRDNH